jgi:hypothetical protein
MMAGGSDLAETHTTPAQELETGSVPKENGPVQEEAHSTIEIVDNSQPASMLVTPDIDDGYF